MPIHIDGAVAPAAACPAKVSQRKAPGAIRAMAFIVSPVRPKVCFISVEFSAIDILLCLSSGTKSFRATAFAKPGQRRQQQSHGAQRPQNAEQWLSVEKKQAPHQTHKPSR